MKRALSIVVSALAVIAALPAAETAPPPLLSNSPTRKLPLVVEDITVVAKAHLYVTSDGGATWKVAQELVPVPNEIPRFTFTAPVDGVYGFASAVTFTTGHREPEPRPGQMPQLMIQIDTTPPAIERFSARVESLVDGHVNIRFGWAISDAFPAEQPATMEVSTDGGTTFAPLQRGPAQGNLTASVPLPGTGQRLAVRLRAEDKAGNISTSAVSQVDAASVPASIPVITDSTALAAALASLPTIDAPPAPVRAPASLPAPPSIVEPIPEPAPVPASTVTPLKPVETPPEVTTAKPATSEVETLHGKGMDQEYRQALAEKDSGAKPAWQDTKERPAPAPESTPVRPVAPSFPPGIPPSGSLTPSQAQSLLVQAREAHLAGDDTQSLRFYRRLRDSSVSSQAILEELRLLRDSKRIAEGLAMVQGLPPAQLSDSVQIEHGRLLIASGKARDAMAPLTRVRAGTPQADEALFVIAQALAADGKADNAKKVYAAVAKGTGPWALAAQQQLAGQ